jgi:hypothetical protein
MDTDMRDMVKDHGLAEIKASQTVFRADLNMCFTGTPFPDDFRPEPITAENNEEVKPKSLGAGHQTGLQGKGIAENSSTG